MRSIERWAILVLLLLCLASGVWTVSASNIVQDLLMVSGQGIASGTYTSGITTTGTIGQTCVINLLNNGNVTGSASVALTGTNTIAGGSVLININPGYGNTAPSTSGTASAGTAAACSGTAVITTTLTGTFTGTVNLLGATNITVPTSGFLNGTLSVATPASDAICAHGSDTSVGGITCTNSSDATGSYQSFATTWAQPAYFWAPNREVQICAQFGMWISAPTGPNLLIDLAIGGTQLYAFTQSGETFQKTNTGFTDCWVMVSSDIGFHVFTQAGLQFNIGNNPPYNTLNTIAQPKNLTMSANTIAIGVEFAATGIASGTYTSGITATGTIGQTCVLGTFNNGNTGGAATVALTGTNTIAGGTALVITNTGQSSTSAATSATASNGTATCSGTATVSTVLGGAQGNILQIQSRTVQQIN
jgi:hypothetical protein